MSSTLDFDIEIVYESDNFVIVNKPPDLLINSDDENQMNTLHRLLISKICKENSNSNNLKHGFHFVHRLDYATSGVICLAKNKKASSLAGKLFESRKVDKFYIALVRGDLQNEMTAVNISIGYDKRCLESNKKMCAIGDNCLLPKSAVTKIVILDRGFYDNEPATKILMKPLTGRRHQLRLHCHLLGHNIIGDYTYSDRKDVEPPRMFLHSYRLILPIKNEYIDAFTDDPFTQKNDICKSWSSKCVVNEISDTNISSVFEKLDKLEIETEYI